MTTKSIAINLGAMTPMLCRMGPLQGQTIHAPSRITYYRHKKGQRFHRYLRIGTWLYYTGVE